jgi:hypothetical protein
MAIPNRTEMAAVVFPRGLTAGSAPSGAGLVIELAVGYTTAMSWMLERDGDVVIVRMSGTKANVQNDAFFADLHAAFDRLERIETVAARLDDEIPIILSNAAGIRVRAQRYAEIKGHAPPWAPVEAGP